MSQAKKDDDDVKFKTLVLKVDVQRTVKEATVALCLEAISAKDPLMLEICAVLPEPGGDNPSTLLLPSMEAPRLSDVINLKIYADDMEPNHVAQILTAVGTSPLKTQIRNVGLHDAPVSREFLLLSNVEMFCCNWQTHVRNELLYPPDCHQWSETLVELHWHNVRFNTLAELSIATSHYPKLERLAVEDCVTESAVLEYECNPFYDLPNLSYFKLVHHCDGEVRCSLIPGSTALQSLFLNSQQLKTVELDITQPYCWEVYSQQRHAKDIECPLVQSTSIVNYTFNGPHVLAHANAKTVQRVSNLERLEVRLLPVRIAPPIAAWTDELSRFTRLMELQLPLLVLRLSIIDTLLMHCPSITRIEVSGRRDSEYQRDKYRLVVPPTVMFNAAKNGRLLAFYGCIKWTLVSRPGDDLVPIGHDLIEIPTCFTDTCCQVFNASVRKTEYKGRVDENRRHRVAWLRVVLYTLACKTGSVIWESMVPLLDPILDLCIPPGERPELWTTSTAKLFTDVIRSFALSHFVSMPSASTKKRAHASIE